MRRTALLLAVLALAAGAVTWVVEPNLIIGLKSPRAAAWVLGLGAVCAAVGGLAYLATRRPRLSVALGVLPGLVATAYFVALPILNPRELDEALPTTSGDPFEPVATGTVASSAPAAPATTMKAAAAPPPAPSQPSRVSGGELRGLAGHDAKGQVGTYRLADGSHVIRFENVDIGGTPDPQVYVIRGADQRQKGGVHLGELKAEKGSFNYVLPAGFAPDGFTVLVWCEQFDVEIANATQA